MSQLLEKSSLCRNVNERKPGSISASFAVHHRTCKNAISRCHGRETTNNISFSAIFCRCLIAVSSSSVDSDQAVSRAHVDCYRAEPQLAFNVLSKSQEIRWKCRKSRSCRRVAIMALRWRHCHLLARPEAASCFCASRRWCDGCHVEVAVYLAISSVGVFVNCVTRAAPREIRVSRSLQKWTASNECNN